MKPLDGRSGERNRMAFPETPVRASAARYPLRTAPSMVAGQPVAVQSPARNTRGQGVIGTGRWASIPGRGEYVAFTSLITVDLTRFAARAAGKNSRTSLSASSTISVRDLSIRVFDELTTSSM